MIDTNKLQEAINKSELWQEINAKAKAMYEAAGIIPSEEEYQALRNVLIFKTIKDDASVLKLYQDMVWQELSKEVTQ
jgi:methionine salvage enolase-phosphatase E1